jgi:hypothetical protein
MLRVPTSSASCGSALFSAPSSAASWALNVSARFKSAVTVYVLLPLLLLPQMLLGGLIVDFDDLRSRAAPHVCPPWFGELTASRWAFEALAVEQYQANAYQRHFEAADRELSGLDYRMNDHVPALLGRLDALVLAAPERREKIRALLVREFRALQANRRAMAGAAAAVAAWRPRIRAALESLKTALREWSRRAASRAPGGAGAPQRNPASPARRAWRKKVCGLRESEYQPETRRPGAAQGACWIRPRAGGTLRAAADPVYQPRESPWGRAPVMAGEKRLGNRTFQPTDSIWGRCG